MREKREGKRGMIPGGKPLTLSERSKLGDILDRHLTEIFGRDVEAELFPETPTDFMITQDFPRDLGLRFYNEAPEKLIREGERARVKPRKDEKEQGRVESAFREYIQIFRSMVDRAIAGKKPTRKDEDILTKVLSPPVARVSGAVEEETGRNLLIRWRAPLPYIHYTLWLWVYFVWRGEISVRHCKAQDCDKVFFPVRSDQQYCSKRCANRVWAQKHRRITMRRTP